MAGTSGGDWRITGEERSKHDAQFFQLKPVNGFVTGEQAKGFFMQSGLPTPVLGQIWTLADMNNDGKMDRKEFSIAMHLIKKKLQGFELPKQLPASLKADPSPMVGSFGTMPAGSAMMPMGGVPPMAGMAPMAGPQPMGMGMPMMSGMAPTAMASSSLAMPIMSNGLAPAMSQTRFMGPGAPGMGMPGSIADKPRTGSFTAQAPLPATSGGSFAMPHPSKLKYTQMFNINDRNKKGSLTGVEARALLVHTGLPQNILAQIWTLSDIDKDGKLTCDEFCIAMHLSDLAKMGQPLPTVLPPELIPGKARSGSFGNVSQPPQPVAPSQKADSFGDLLGNMGMPPPQPPIPATNGETPQEEEKPAFTFEDKRKENFDKGQAELERRRQALADQMKRENEARLEKERQEQEKRERYRQEQERRRLQEMEKQLEKQRQIEREKEEQRQKMMEQREAARKELDRQRQMEWERQRKDQLLAEKAREYEQLAAVKLRASNLKCEIESLEGKKTEIGQKIEQVRKGVTDFTSSIESMRGTRDAKINDIDKLQKESQELGDRLIQVQAERESLNYRVQTTAQSNPLSEPHRTVLHGVELKKTSIQKLKKELESIERETENKLVEIDDSNVELASLKSRLTDLQQEMTSYQQKQADKTRQHQEELQSKAKQEKEKQEKLRKELEAQRLREEEERKKKEQAKPVQEDSWIAFANDKPATTASDDIWSAAFSSVSSDPNQTSDTGIWGNAFSSQTTAPSASVSSMSSKQGSKFKAIYPFEARNPDELTLDPGDMVWVPDDQTGAEPGWMGGEVDGRKGWFPKDYVEKLPDSQQHEQSSQNFAIENAFSSGAMTSGSGSGTGQLGTTEESLFTGSMAVSPTPGQGQTAPEGLQAQALYPWKAKKDNHLSFNKGDLIMVKEQQEMWWSGELNGQTGWFPKSYVKLVSGPAATPSLQDSRSGTPQSTSAPPMAGGSARATPIVQEPTPEAENYVAMFNYSSSEPGDLTFNQGELIVVTKKDGDWWTGSLNGKTGIFPANYVKLTDQTFPSGVQQVTTDISTETKTQDHNITNSPPSTLNIPSHPLPQQPKTESVESSTNTKSPFGDDLFANFEANIEPLSMESKPKQMDDGINLAPKVDANIPLSNDIFTSKQGEGDFGSAFSDDPFASESPFTPDFSFSTSKSQTPASVNNPSLVENKTLLDKVIKDQVVSPIVTPNESCQELSMYFPDSQVKENPFKESQKSETAKDNENVHMESANTTRTPSSEIKVEPSVGVIAPDKEAKLAPVVEICTAQSQDPNKAMDPFANFDNAVNAGTSASDSDAFSLDPFADFETQLDKGFENTADNSTKGSQSFSQNMFPAFENPSAAESVGDTKVETDKNTEKSSSDGVQTEKKTDFVTAEFNFNTDPFADFANFSDFSKTNAVNTNESSTQASGVSFEIKQDTSFANFANFSDFSKANIENTTEPSPQTSGDSLEIKQNLSTDSSADPFADFSNFTNSQTDSKAARSGLPNEVTSSSDSQQKTVETPVSDTVAHTSTTEKGDSELSDNFDFIQNLSKAKPSLQNGDSKDESQLEDNFSFIQSFSKSDASTNKVVPDTISAPSESISHDSLPSQNPNVMLSDMDITSALPSLQQEPSSKPQTPQPAPATQQPPAAQSLAPQQPQQQQQKAGSSSTLKKPEIASVIAAYTATGPEQLSLQPGQILQVRKKSPSGWWEGELQARGQKKKIGWFPANYVKLLGSSARSTPDTSSQSGSPANTLNRTATPTIPPPQPQATAVTESKYIDQVIALYPYTAQHEDELTFHKDSVINILKKDDDSWWQGELNGIVGLFPSNYVGPLTQSPPQENTWSTDPAVLAQTSSTESKRQNYIHELINTEETYMSDMSIVLDAFYKPMSDAKVMTEEELSSVFVNWKELIVCNTKLLKSLRVRKKMCGKGQVINVLGDILCENFPHMGAYIRFCSCQLNAAALIQRKTENSQEFRELQKKCVQDPRTKGMPMSSFLLKPMQRITKYPLMLQKILQYTPEGHPDRQNLQDALAEAEKLCNQVNEGVRERENCDKLEWIQQAVQCEGLPEKIIFNSLTNCLGPRKIIYSGTLYKVKSNKELVGFLFNDFLLLTSPLTNSTSLFIMDPKSKAKYRMYKQPIFLNEVAVKKVEDDSDPFMFHIAHIDRVYNLKCPNQTERDAWVRHIEASAKIYNDTEKKKREKAYNSVTKPKGVGRLLVIILEGINLAPSADVKKIPGVGRLLVVIVEGRDLQPSDANGKSDPYCEVSMGAQEHKTPVINSTLNPKWNKSMQFTIKDVEQDVLCITVYDRDLFSPNDFLGRTEVRVSELLGSEKRGPVTKSLLLHEVSQGEVVVKLDLQLYEDV